MKINWKLRLQNKTTLVSILVTTVAFVYQLLSLFGVTPKVTESEIMTTITMAINVLVFMGIVVDPTTSGMSDSDRAMGYDEPFQSYELSEDDILETTDDIEY